MICKVMNVCFALNGIDVGHKYKPQSAYNFLVVSTQH